MSVCPARGGGQECRLLASMFGGAFCWWCDRRVSRFCVVDGQILEHHHEPTP